MENLWANALSRRYASVLDQFERAIRQCPNELWEESLWEVKKTDPGVWPVRRAGTKSSGKTKASEALLQVHSQFWNVAYHALFHIDFYLAGGDRKDFELAMSKPLSNFTPAATRARWV